MIGAAAAEGRKPPKGAQPAHKQQATNLARREAALFQVEELLRRQGRIGSWEWDQGSVCVHGVLRDETGLSEYSFE